MIARHLGAISIRRRAMIEVPRAAPPRAATIAAQARAARRA
jgi:hypothetical protein